MGYQESYVRVTDKNDFEKLVAAFREVGKDYYESNGAGPVKIITLKKPIQGDLENMCHPEIHYKFDEGEKFVYVVGDRHLQRSPKNLLNNHPISGVEIYFTECFPSEDIFTNNDKTDMAIHEEFEWT